MHVYIDLCNSNYILCIQAKKKEILFNFTTHGWQYANRKPWLEIINDGKHFYPFIILKYFTLILALFVR